MSLTFVPLETSSLQIAVLFDASFVGNADLFSQLGYVVTIMDENNNLNVLHYSSFKSKRVTRSVLASELFAVVYAFDYALTLMVTLKETLKRSIPLAIITDSKSFIREFGWHQHHSAKKAFN